MDFDYFAFIVGVKEAATVLNQLEFNDLGILPFNFDHKLAGLKGTRFVFGIELLDELS